LEIVLNNFIRASREGIEKLSVSTNKRVVVYRFDREPVRGFASPGSWSSAESIEVMTPEGSVAKLAVGDIKVVCFVKDFGAGGWAGEQRVFKSRPKNEGLWIRAQFRDNEYLEGILQNDLTQVDGAGFLVTPPDATSNTQRVYIPNSAVKELKVLGVVGSPVHKKRSRDSHEGQIDLFEP
jgi:hypothetical protein